MVKVRTLFLIVIIFLAGQLSAKGFLILSQKRIVDDFGKEIQLRGVNLGGWLLMEPWIFMLNNQEKILSEKDIWDLMERRFGTEKMQVLIQTHRSNFITREDIQYIKSLGMNFIRVPIWWRVLEDKKYSGKGYGYLDDVIQWCQENEVYCLLDLHGAPGGQNTGADISGESDIDQFWKEEKWQDRTIELWKKIALRYKNNTTVAGYDILNEPWSTPSFEALLKMYDKIIKAIRLIDMEHLIFIEDGLKGYNRLQAAESWEWDNIVYSTHYYPQNLDDSKNALANFFPNLFRAERVFSRPLHIGEFNSIQWERGGAEMVGNFIRVFNQYGWSWNLWTYKKLENNENINWGLVGNMRRNIIPNLYTDSFEEIRKFFQNCNTTQLNKNEELIKVIKKNVNSKYITRIEEEDKITSLDRKDKNAKQNTQDIILYPEIAYLLRSVGGQIQIDWEDRSIAYWDQNDGIFWDVDIPQLETFSILLNYSASSAGSLMRLLIDDILYHEFTINKTKGWDNYKKLDLGNIELSQGKHTIKLLGYNKKRSFIKLREMQLKKTDRKVHLLQGKESNIIELTPFNIFQYIRKSEICIEWQNNPPNIGSLKSGDGVEWRFKVKANGKYKVYIVCSAKAGGSKLEFSMDNKRFNTIPMPHTHGWHNYKKVDVGDIVLTKGIHTLQFITLPHNLEGAGNIRYIFVEKLK